MARIYVSDGIDMKEMPDLNHFRAFHVDAIQSSVFRTVIFNSFRSTYNTKHKIGIKLYRFVLG